ncbi:MAG: tRNA pseudouridine(55) synthase TruB [Chloroflexota bacterium]
MLGVVNLDKPTGPTSHDMVGLMRRLTGIRRIGHAGTLDPLASGVLPILVGAATRFSEELSGSAKRYDATIRLGQRSATDDAEGPISPGSPPPDEAHIRAALVAFIGTISQLPPTFSARKVAGRRAHRAARAGEPLVLEARSVRIDAIEVLAVAAGDATTDVRIDLRCGPGTYVRSLARDLGDALGCGGHLAALRRTEAAGLRADDAVTPETLERLAGEGRLGEALLPVERLLRLPKVMLGAASAARFVNGVVLEVEGDDGRHAVYASGGLIGIGRLSGGKLQPEKVLPVADR